MSDTLEKPAVKPSIRDEWVMRVLGIDVAKSQAAPKIDARDDVQDEEPAEDTLGLDEGEVRGRLNEIGIRLRNRSDAEELGDIRDLFKEAVASFKSKELVDCDELLTEIADALDAVPDSGRAKKEIGGGGPSLRAIATLGLTWQKRCEEQANELTDLVGALVDDLIASEICETPEEEAEVTNNINKLLDSADRIRGLSSELEDMLDRETLDELANATPPKRKELLAPMLKQLDVMEDEIKKDELLDLIKENHLRPIDPQAALMALAAEFRKQIAG